MQRRELTNSKVVKNLFDYLLFRKYKELHSPLQKRIGKMFQEDMAEEQNRVHVHTDKILFDQVNRNIPE